MPISTSTSPARGSGRQSGRHPRRASAAYQAFAATVPREDLLARAERTLEVCLAYGTVAIRSHTNIESQSRLNGVEAMIELRERCRDRITLQVVAHLTGDAPRKLGRLGVGSRGRSRAARTSSAVSRNMPTSHSPFSTSCSNLPSGAGCRSTCTPTSISTAEGFCSTPSSSGRAPTACRDASPSATVVH